ncbi:hypothetical protein F5Y10DRAFT_231415 [Nemania abortiva]|nr:hypothetical protein F5Y10DRAFT_231415 [Nemania abortiva]
MHHNGRKRRVTTCAPCQARKQKCNRQYPCNHCTRRLRPEECIYGTGRPLSTATVSQSPKDQHPKTSEDSADWGRVTSSEPGRCPPDSQLSSLTKSFGYSEDSRFNTIALLREHDGDDENNSASAGATNPSVCISDSVKKELERMPERSIVDFLIQHFISELHWMKQVVYLPSFLIQYEKWWAGCLSSTIQHAEFASLIFYICSYTTLFLPSPSHAIDSIRGLPLREIRETCCDAGSRLAQACLLLDWRGSLIRVQSILFAALKFSCEGRTDRFWEGIHSASLSAQKAGLQIDSLDSHSGSNGQIERDRTLYTLYALDSHLARQLDRIPFFPDDTVTDAVLRLHLNRDTNEPDLFTERMLQVQLGRFWRLVGPGKKGHYDPTERERNYERFVLEYVGTLPSAFGLEPDIQWDKKWPKLSLQRQLLHVAVFDSVCWNFRPLLLLKSSYIEALPAYKKVLLRSQKNRLALAALRELDAVTTLHSLVGGSYTRFSAIIFNTFEPCVLLLHLCSNPEFPFDQAEDQDDLLVTMAGKLTRAKCLRAAELALSRLNMLSDVSEMATSGAQVLTRLFIKASQPVGSASSDKGDVGTIATDPSEMGLGCLDITSINQLGGHTEAGPYSFPGWNMDLDTSMFLTPDLNPSMYS